MYTPKRQRNIFHTLKFQLSRNNIRKYKQSLIFLIRHIKGSPSDSAHVFQDPEMSMLAEREFIHYYLYYIGIIVLFF